MSHWHCNQASTTVALPIYIYSISISNFGSKFERLKTDKQIPLPVVGGASSGVTVDGLQGGYYEPSA